MRIGANVTVGHMAVLHACTIEDECLIGIQSTVLSGAHVRGHSIVGAAALVPENKEFPAASLLIGVPARPAREVTAQEVQYLIIERAAEYRALAADERAAAPQHRGGLIRRMPPRLTTHGPAIAFVFATWRPAAARGNGWTKKARRRSATPSCSRSSCASGPPAAAPLSWASRCSLPWAVSRRWRMRAWPSSARTTESAAPKALQIKAALELARRLQREPAEARPEIRSPDDAARILAPRIAALPRETLQVVLLDGRHRVMGVSQIAEGRVNTVGARMAEVFRDAVRQDCPAVDPGPQPSLGRPGAFRGRHQAHAHGRRGRQDPRRRGARPPGDRSRSVQLRELREQGLEW